MAESSSSGERCGPTATNRWPGAASLRKCASRMPSSGSSARSRMISSGWSWRTARSSFSPKEENGAAISIAGAVQASCERNTSLTISRKERSEEISAVRIVRSVIGVSPSSSLDQLQLLDQRAHGGGARRGAGGEAEEDRRGWCPADPRPGSGRARIRAKLLNFVRPSGCGPDCAWMAVGSMSATVMTRGLLVQSGSGRPVHLLGLRFQRRKGSWTISRLNRSCHDGWIRIGERTSECRPRWRRSIGRDLFSSHGWDCPSRNSPAEQQGLRRHQLERQPTSRGNCVEVSQAASVAGLGDRRIGAEGSNLT